MTPDQEIRAAAEKLRGLIDAVDQDMVTNPYWSSDDHPPHAYPTLYARGVDGALGGPAGAFAAAMHPGVVTAIADWLEHTAELHEAETDPRTPGCQRCADEDYPCSDMRDALAVARAINGGQP